VHLILLGYSCEYGDDNYTLIITRFTENSQTFNTTTVENSVQAYTLNVTYNNSIYTLVSATLDYNGTDYQGTKIDSTPDTIFTRTLSTPTFETGIFLLVLISKLYFPSGTPPFSSVQRGQFTWS